MKVLILTRYARLGASSRLRFLQYLPQLEAHGVEVEVAPLFVDRYLQDLQRGERDVVQAIRSYWNRFVRLFSINAYDVIWIEKECLPWVPYAIEGLWLMSAGVPYVLDYDDAVFHSYDEHRWSFIRNLLSNKHKELIRGAVMVVAGNQYLVDYAEKCGARRVEYLPTAIDIERYAHSFHQDECTSRHMPCIGWIGQRSTAEYLLPLVPVFRRLQGEGRASVKAIGIEPDVLGLDFLGTLPWTEGTEVDDIKKFDIGIMPLADGSFERGKCGYKIIQYMACGLPVVASPVGVNRQLIEHGVNGFLAETLDEWTDAINTLLENEQLRIQMGKAGLEKVKAHYCIQVTGPRLAGLLKGIPFLEPRV